MMSVKEYAKELNLTVAEVLKKCKELGIKASEATSELNDEEIILLDNTLNLISTDDELDYEDEEAIAEVVEDIVSNINIDDSSETPKEKIKKKPDFNNSKEEYKNQKKQMYKNKI